MLLKSQTIINQEELVSILETQLQQATSRLTELKNIDSKFQATISELETLLEQHPDYQSVVSDRLKYKEPEPTLAPVKIEIIGEEATAFETQQPHTTYTAFELDAYDSLFGEQPPQDTPKSEKIESPYSNEAEIAKVNAAFDKISEEKITTSPEQKLEVDEVQPAKPASSCPKPEPTPDSTEELLILHSKLMSNQTRAAVESFKAEIGEAKAKELWELCTIPERNYIKCLMVASNPKKSPATLGHRFQYIAPITGIKYIATYLGYYLHGEPIQGENKRAILVKGEAILCDKSDLRPGKYQPLSPEERDRLEKIISEPEQPTAQEIANNNFTGLAPAPKLPTASQTGKQPESTVSESRVGVQAGDMIEVHTKDSIAYGKTVEVNFVKEDGTVQVVWDGKNVYIPASGYKIFSKGLGFKKA
ncbi:MAG: hypothetical protein SWX82_29765 [Cyanobacteriota bacterium]|nr:hypothetical protein [Cyanobacteriota bacterium]